MNTQNKHVNQRVFEPLDFIVFGFAMVVVALIGWVAWGFGTAWTGAMGTMVVGALAYFAVKALKINHDNKMRNMAGVVIAVLAFVMATNAVSAPAANAALVQPKTHQVIVMQQQGIVVVADEIVGMNYPDGATEVCGWVTCSVYLSHWQTWLLQNDIAAWGGVFQAVGSVCSLLVLYTAIAAVFTVPVCVSVMGLYWGFFTNATAHAAGDGGCLRIRFPLWAFYNDHSGYCHKT